MEQTKRPHPEQALRDSKAPVEGRTPLIQAALVAGILAAIARPALAQPATTTPIEHLIVVVGENLSFDHLFA
ncbi:MAG TPA: hypothetical protein VLX85_12590, partial [Stellaceae bacterium]|nr:hypothetical protein [Stellaceae bacterium]